MKEIKVLDRKDLSLMLFLLLFVLYTVVYMTKCMFSSAMATVVEAGIMTKSQTGAINAAFWLVYAPFQIVGGLAADKYSPSKLIIIGLVGAIVSNMIIYSTESYEIIMAAWIFNAIIQFGLWPSIFKIITLQIIPEVRKTAIFWILFATSVGQATSMFVASFVGNWKQNFIVSIISLFTMLILWLIIYGLMQKHMVKVVEKKKTEKTLCLQTNKMRWQEMFGTGVFLIMVAGFLRNAVDNGIKMVTPVMLMESYVDLPASIATRLSTILIVFSLIGTFFMKFVQKKISRNEAKAVSIMLTFSMPLLAASCFVGKIHYMLMLAILSLIIVFVHGAAPLTGSFAAARFSNYGRSATVSGLLNAGSSLGNVIASFVFLKISEVLTWGTVMFICGILILMSILFCLAIMRAWTRFIEQ